MSLRDYQQECLDEIRSSWAAGIENQLVALPTGSGKTVLFANLPEHLKLSVPDQMLVLVHRDKLVQQNADKLRKYNPHLTVEIEAGDRRADPNADVIVGSIQTFQHAKRRERFNPAIVKVVIVDEAHHCPSPSYLKVLEYFGVYKGAANRASNKLLVGLTATPRRGDKIGLEKVFDKIVFARSIREMVEANWLVEPTGYHVSTLTDISDVGTKGGDFKEGELADAVNTFERNRLVVQEYQKLAPGMTFAAFTVTIQHSKDLADVFRSYGISCEAISGETPDREREILYREHDSGALRGLASCGVLCIDDETEILTRAGWRGRESLQMADKIANWEEGQIFFAPPAAIVRRRRLPGERMVSLESQDHSIRVTEDHRMVYRTWCVPDAAFKLCRANELVGRFHQIAVSGKEQNIERFSVSDTSRRSKLLWCQRMAKRSFHLRSREGFTWEAARQEAARRLKRDDWLRWKNPHELTIDECLFIGFWIGDGSVTYLRRSGREYKVVQSPTYPRIIQWIDNLILRLGIDFIRRDKAGSAIPHVVWSFPRGTGGGSQQRRGLYHLEPYLTKEHNPLLWGLNEKQFDALILGLWYADGDHGKAIHVPKGKRISGSRRKPLDLLQAIACCRGYHATLRPETRSRKNPKHAQVYRLSLKKNTAIAVSTTRLAIEEEWRDEPVWCVTSDTGKIIVRRHGKVYITGNSEGWDSPRCTVGLGTRPTKSPTLFIQQLGRQLRPYPAPEDAASYTGDFIKKFAIWIDFCDNTGRHSIVTLPTLFGLRADFDLAGKSATRTAKQLEDLLRRTPGLNIDSYTSLRDIEALVKKVDLLGPIQIPAEVQRMSKFGWVKDGIAGYRLSLADRTFYINQDVLGQWEVQENIEGHAKILFAGKQPEAFTVADAAIPRDQIGLVLASAKWNKEPPTEKQCWALYYRDGGLHHKYYSGVALYRHAMKQYTAGNTEWSKGGISNRLNALAEAKKVKT